MEAPDKIPTLSSLKNRLAREKDTMVSFSVQVPVRDTDKYIVTIGLDEGAEVNAINFSGDTQLEAEERANRYLETGIQE